MGYRFMKYNYGKIGAKMKQKLQDDASNNVSCILQQRKYIVFKRILGRYVLRPSKPWVGGSNPSWITRKNFSPHAVFRHMGTAFIFIHFSQSVSKLSHIPNSFASVASTSSTVYDFPVENEAMPLANSSSSSALDILPVATGFLPGS